MVSLAFGGIKFSPEYILGTDGIPIENIAENWTYYNRYEFSDGLTFIDGIYYNLVSEKIIDFPDLHGKNSYACDPFHNGYAAMLINGADGLPYITIINKNGDMMFDPQKGFSSVYMSLDGEHCVAVQSGDIYRLGISVFEVNGNILMNISCPPNSKTEYNVSCGLLRINNGYVNITDGLIIGNPDVQILKSLS